MMYQLDSISGSDSGSIKRLTRPSFLILNDRLSGSGALTVSPQGSDFKEHAEESEDAEIS
jgi:hypothetical protein